MKTFLSHLTCGLLVLGLFSAATSADELLKNPDFKKGLTNWNLYIHAKAKNLIQKQVTKGVFTLKISAPTRGATDVQFIQKVALKKGQKYDFSFEARQDSDKKKLPVKVLCLQQAKPFKPYGLSKFVKISEKWSRYKLTFTPKGLVKGNPPTMRLFLGSLVGSLQLKNFSLVEHVEDKDHDEHDEHATEKDKD